MSRRSARLFDQEVAKLSRARTHSLRSAIWPSSGAAPQITPQKIRKTISKLQRLSQETILHSKAARKVFAGNDYKKQWHPKRGKGFGRYEKRKSFKRWYDHYITTLNCVYVFWQNNRCLYVGRTLNGKGRPTSHFEKHWFGRATRVDVYGFDRKRDVPRFECMFTHYHPPSYSRMKPASKKYYSHCPVCDANKLIRIEVRRLFRLR
jgi:hypothetical protein